MTPAEDYVSGCRNKACDEAVYPEINVNISGRSCPPRPPRPPACPLPHVFLSLLPASFILPFLINNPDNIFILWAYQLNRWIYDHYYG